MPGLQSWVNRWVGVNKNHVQFPDDDEPSPHVNVRNISAQQQAAKFGLRQWRCRTITG